MKKTALLFGTFDGIHPGHLDAFRQVHKHGASLIICLTQDVIVRRLKGKAPRYSYKQREEALQSIQGILRVIPGDETLGSFRAIETLHPDMIALGYDQEELAQAITAWMKIQKFSIPLVRLTPFHPEMYKSSILRNLYD